MWNRNIETFLGCDAAYEEGHIVLFGAPFDSTTSYRPGTRFASRTMRAESYGLETYSPYQDLDLEDARVFDGGDLELPFGDTACALGMIRDFATEVLTDGKLPFLIGGEHLVSLPAIEAAAEKYPDLAVIHFDAHTDLRDEYLGNRLSHAFAGLSDAVAVVKGRPVYLTIDLDVLDPSVFPGTGTPEAGGVNFIELMKAALSVIHGCRIVACDMVELSPPLDASGASTATALKLLREMLLAFEEDFIRPQIV